MKKNVLITGPPGCGKTTLVKEIISAMHDMRPAGFYTEEIRVAGVRQGFALVCLDGQRGVLAGVNIESPFRVGKYRVDLQGFDTFLSACTLKSPRTPLVIVDEIGKMECLSPLFRETIGGVLDSDVLCIATIALHGDRFIEAIKEREDVTIITMKRGDAESLAPGILSHVRGLVCQDE